MILVWEFYVVTKLPDVAQEQRITESRDRNTAIRVMKLSKTYRKRLLWKSKDDVKAVDVSVDIK